jgi:bifunctional N-acetylglucosamine-1-phosphate-uridyltransferase/glucosamine-1-phosphate-acetyltransferase GlmU-like protein
METDYTKNEYKKESRFFVQAVELGVAKAIKEADDLPSCKKAKIKELVEDYGLSPEVSAAIVDTLALVLRGDTSKSITASSAPVSSSNGKGRVKLTDNIVWEGDVINGKPCGKGKIIHILIGSEEEAEVRNGNLYFLSPLPISLSDLEGNTC